MGRRFRKRSKASKMVSDVTYISARLPWWLALLFGLILFLIFYYGFPAYLLSALEENSQSKMAPAIEAIFARRIHWFQWLGVAFGLVGSFFAVRNFAFQQSAGRSEQGIVSLLAKIIARKID